VNNAVAVAWLTKTLVFVADTISIFGLIDFGASDFFDILLGGFNANINLLTGAGASLVVLRVPM